MRIAPLGGKFGMNFVSVPVFVGLTWLGLPCMAQTPVDPGDQPIRLNVTRVSLLFTVQDKKGRFITGLQREN